MENKKPTTEPRLLRSVKKNELLLKKEREKEKIKISDLIGSLTIDSSHILSPEKIEGVYWHCQNRSLIHSYAEIKFIDEIEELRVDLSLMRYSSQGENETILILPAEWSVKGGMILNINDFIENINELSFFYDDDYHLFNSRLDSSILFMGDRISDSSVVSFSFRLEGKYFVRILNEMKKQQKLA